MTFDPFAPEHPPLYEDGWTALHAVAEQDQDGSRLRHMALCKRIARRLASKQYGHAATVLQELRSKKLVTANGGIADTWSVTEEGRLLLEVHQARAA